MKYLTLIIFSFSLVSHASTYKAVSTEAGIRARGGAPMNVNRNLVGGGWHGYYPAPYHHPVATVVHSVPSSCVTTVVKNITYTQCGPTWYRPQYVGTSVQYVMVDPPK